MQVRCAAVLVGVEITTGVWLVVLCGDTGSPLHDSSTARNLNVWMDNRVILPGI